MPTHENELIKFYQFTDTPDDLISELIIQQIIFIKNISYPTEFTYTAEILDPRV